MGDRAYLLILELELGNSKRQLMLICRLADLGNRRRGRWRSGSDREVFWLGVDGNRLTSLLAGQRKLRRAEKLIYVMI